MKRLVMIPDRTIYGYPKVATKNSVGIDVHFNSLMGIVSPYNVKLDVDELDIALKKEGVLDLIPGHRYLLGTGFTVEMAEYYELQVRPKSGLSYKKGLIVLNSPGTIESDYLDEVGVILVNTGLQPIKIPLGEAIAQVIFKEVVDNEEVELVVGNSTKELVSNTIRDGGFGSTSN